MPCPLWVARSTTSDNEADSNTYKRLFTGHLYKLRSSQAQTIFGPAKALGPKEEQGYFEVPATQAGPESANLMK